MILDKLSNAQLYKNLSKRIEAALTYLERKDFTKIENGKFSIDGDNIFALVSEYDTKPIEKCRLEAHKKYIDVQFVAEGEEFFGYSPLSNQTITEPYKEENDIVFYEGEKSICRFYKSMFAIFFPEDVHMPGVMVDNPAKVKKVVIKVKLD